MSSDERDGRHERHQQLAEGSLLLGIEPAVLDRHARREFDVPGQLLLDLRDGRAEVAPRQARGDGNRLPQPVALDLCLPALGLDFGDLV